MPPSQKMRDAFTGARNAIEFAGLIEWLYNADGTLRVHRSEEGRHIRTTIQQFLILYDEYIAEVPVYRDSLLDLVANPTPNATVTEGQAPITPYGPVRNPFRLPKMVNQLKLKEKLKKMGISPTAISWPKAVSLAANLNKDGIAVLAAMRSLLVLRQLQSLLHHSERLATEALPNQADRRASCISMILMTINMAQANNVARAYLNRCSQVQLHLALCVGLSGGETRYRNQDLTQIASSVGWKNRRVSYHGSCGARMLRITGGHVGLVCLIPFTRMPEFQFTTKANVFDLRPELASMIGKCMQDQWARVMCAFGQEFHGVIMGLKEASGAMEAVLKRSNDFTIMSLDELHGLLRHWKNNPCQCR